MIAYNVERLIDTFSRDLKIASEFESSNQEDDLAIKAAIVGFSYNEPTESWAKGHYEFVKSRLDREYPEADLASYGSNGKNVRLFFAIAIGYLLGLYQQEKISDEDFRIAELQIHGIIMLHLPQITAQPA